LYLKLQIQRDSRGLESTNWNDKKPYISCSQEINACFT
jgi:hypothetical protein